MPPCPCPPPFHRRHRHRRCLLLVRESFQDLLSVPPSSLIQIRRSQRRCHAHRHPHRLLRLLHPLRRLHHHYQPSLAPEAPTDCHRGRFHPLADQFRLLHYYRCHRHPHRHPHRHRHPHCPHHRRCSKATQPREGAAGGYCRSLPLPPPLRRRLFLRPQPPLRLLGDSNLACYPGGGRQYPLCPLPRPASGFPTHCHHYSAGRSLGVGGATPTPRSQNHSQNLYWDRSLLGLSVLEDHRAPLRWLGAKATTAHTRVIVDQAYRRGGGGGKGGGGWVLGFEVGGMRKEVKGKVR